MIKTENKTCNKCGETKTLDCFYSQIKYNINGEKYIYYIPVCKECTKKKSYEWISDNPEKYIEYRRKYDNKPESIKRSKIRNRRWRNNGGQSEWYENNKNSLKEYREKRKSKKHNISQEEWNHCKEFFNNACAYCGISEENAKEQLGQVLHKEHVDPEGSNDITNNIPACRSCNSSKHTMLLDEWYNEDNPKYDLNRYNKIIYWMTIESHKEPNK